MRKQYAKLAIDDALRLSIGIGTYPVQTIQLTNEAARRLGVALIELAAVGMRQSNSHKLVKRT